MSRLKRELDDDLDRYWNSNAADEYTQYTFIPSASFRAEMNRHIASQQPLHNFLPIEMFQNHRSLPEVNNGEGQLQKMLDEVKLQPFEYLHDAVNPCKNLNYDSYTGDVCAICMEIPHIPRSCANGHVFCLECIFQLENTKADYSGTIFECPSCKIYDKAFRNICLEKMINNTHGTCKVCGSSVRYEDACEHTCEQMKHECKYGNLGCNFKGTTKELYEHYSTCHNKHQNLINDYVKVSIKRYKVIEYILNVATLPYSF